jgi:hypothetical protein
LAEVFSGKRPISREIGLFLRLLSEFNAGTDQIQSTLYRLWSSAHFSSFRFTLALTKIMTAVNYSIKDKFVAMSYLLELELLVSRLNGCGQSAVLSTSANNWSVGWRIETD